MYESLCLPKFHCIRHFDTMTMVNPRENPLQPNLDNLKGLSLERTQASMEQKEKHPSRSCKVLADKLDISFEEPYMEEHKACFLKQLQKYMEHQQNILGSLNPEGLKKKIYDLHQPSETLIDLVKIINKHGGFLTQIEREMLIIDLKREDKLSEFLQFVFEKVNEESMKDVIFMVNLIWENFYPIQDLTYSEQQTIEFAQNFISKHLDQIDERLTQINYKSIETLLQGKTNTSHSKERLSMFKKFGTFFTTTVLMVISGFFSNPYTDTEENYYKRELNELGLGCQNDDEFNDNDFDSDDEMVINKKIKH